MSFEGQLTPNEVLQFTLTERRSVHQGAQGGPQPPQFICREETNVSLLLGTFTGGLPSQISNGSVFQILI